MNDNQVIFTSNMTDGVVYAHVLRTYAAGSFHYANLLDIKMPGTGIIRNIGFSDDEVQFIKGAVRNAEDVITYMSGHEDFLFCASLMEMKMALMEAELPEPGNE